MPTLTVTKSYSNGAVLTETMLDDIKSSIETWANTTKLDADNLQDSAVTSSKIADGSVTNAKRASLGQQTSSSSSTFTTTSTSLTDVTNLSVSITTTGRPVFVGLANDINTGTSIVGAISGTTSCTFEVAFLRDSTIVSRSFAQGSAPGATTASHYAAPGAFWYIDTPAAGTYTYKVQIAYNAGSGNLRCNHVKLIAYEL